LEYDLPKKRRQHPTKKKGRRPPKKYKKELKDFWKSKEIQAGAELCQAQVQLRIAM
jgi:hypothetical protein